jgi:hypothetical protein
VLASKIQTADLRQGDIALADCNSPRQAKNGLLLDGTACSAPVMDVARSLAGRILHVGTVAASQGYGESGCGELACDATHASVQHSGYSFEWALTGRSQPKACG